MQLKVSRLDLEKTQKNWPADRPFEPAYLYRRPTEAVERWLVATAAVVPGQSPTLSTSYQDPYVRIPLFCYRLNPAADLALAYMVQLGLSCAASVPADIKKLHLVTGFPVQLLYDDSGESSGIVYWFGFAYLL